MANLTQTPAQVQIDLDAVEASNVGLDSVTDGSDTQATALKKSGFFGLAASTTDAPTTDRAVMLTIARDVDAVGEIRHAQVVITEPGNAYFNVDDGGTLGTWSQIATTAGSQTLSNKTLASPTVTGTLAGASQTLSGTLGVTGATTLSSTLAVTGEASFDDRILLQEATVTRWALSPFSGALDIERYNASGVYQDKPLSFSSTGAATFASTLTATGAMTSSTSVTVNIAGSGNAIVYTDALDATSNAAGMRNRISGQDYLVGINWGASDGRWGLYDATAGAERFSIAKTTGAATFSGNISTGSFSAGGASAGTLIESSGFLASSSTGTSSFTSRGFYNGNGLVGSITTNGSATAYNTSSDPRLKSEFVAMDDAWAAQAVIDSIENKWAGVFYFEADPDTPVAGYNSHALIDNQLGYGGTEGEGPRDAEIGSVYEAAVYEQATDEDGNLLFDDVTEKAKRHRTWQKPVLETFDEVVPAVTEQKAVINEETGETEIITVVVEEETTRKAERQKTESVTETVTVAEAVVDGVLIPEHEETNTTEKPVFTTENVLDQDGNIVYEEYDKVIGTKPRMVEVSPEKRVSPAGVDQSKRVPLLEAALYNALKRIKALEG